MKILAVIGSPRKGDSYEVARLIEEKMKSWGGVEFEYLWLKDAHLELCKGCGVCLTGKGEKSCPLKDDRERIEGLLRSSDGVIFISPVYVVNVTALMKNFIDRFAYTCHRPCYFDKYAMLVSTAGGFGLSQTLEALDWAARTWGFNIVRKLGLESSSLSAAGAARKKAEREIGAAAARFYNAVRNKEKPSPRLFSLVVFKAQRTFFAKAGQESADFIYWKEKGWFERDACYYFPIKINILKRMLVSFIYKTMWLVRR